LPVSVSHASPAKGNQFVAEGQLEQIDVTAFFIVRSNHNSNQFVTPILPYGHEVNFSLIHFQSTDKVEKSFDSLSALLTSTIPSTSRICRRPFMAAGS
jgi:hypothetical protein